MQFKRKNANSDSIESGYYQELIDKMRLSTEKDRIQRFRNVLEGSAKTYYSLLEQFSSLIRTY